MAYEPRLLAKIAHPTPCYLEITINTDARNAETAAGSQGQEREG